MLILTNMVIWQSKRKNKKFNLLIYLFSSVSQTKLRKTLANEEVTHLLSFSAKINYAEVLVTKKWQIRFLLLTRSNQIR